MQLKQCGDSPMIINTLNKQISNFFVISGRAMYDNVSNLDNYPPRVEIMDILPGVRYQLVSEGTIWLPDLKVTRPTLKGGGCTPKHSPTHLPCKNPGPQVSTHA